MLGLAGVLCPNWGAAGLHGLHGARIEIEIALDGGRDPQVDPLMGACDLDTDGTGIGGWAGLNGHVAIECRPPVYLDGGVGNVVPPHVQHPPVTAASAGRPLELSVGFVVSGGSAPAAGPPTGPSDDVRTL